MCAVCTLMYVYLKYYASIWKSIEAIHHRASVALRRSCDIRYLRVPRAELEIRDSVRIRDTCGRLRRTFDSRSQPPTRPRFARGDRKRKAARQMRVPVSGECRPARRGRVRRRRRKACGSQTWKNASRNHKSKLADISRSRK